VLCWKGLVICPYAELHLTESVFISGAMKCVFYYPYSFIPFIISYYKRNNILNLHNQVIKYTLYIFPNISHALSEWILMQYDSRKWVYLKCCKVANRNRVNRDDAWLPLFPWKQRVDFHSWQLVVIYVRER